MRALHILLLITFAALLAACGTPSPPARLVHLPTALPASVSPPAVVDHGHWQLQLPVRVPEYLDRDAMLLPQGQAGLQALAGWRWAEPLRESVPRVLREDLASLLGAGRVWTSPLPPGISVRHQLRVEVLAFEAAHDRRELLLRARCVVLDGTATRPPRAEVVLVRVPLATDDGDALAAAHRMALWRLAERLVAVALSAPA